MTAHLALPPPTREEQMLQETVAFPAFNPAEKLDELVHLSLENYWEVLKVPLHRRPPEEQMAWLRAQMRANRDVLMAKIRVDDQVMKRHKLDALPALLEEIREAKRQNPKLALAVDRG